MTYVFSSTENEVNIKIFTQLRKQGPRHNQVLIGQCAHELFL